MVKYEIIPPSEFKRVYSETIDEEKKLSIIADMCRANALLSVKRAGSGHLGSSFSAMDIVVQLYYREMNTVRVGIESPHRDIYFSSKGHDVPGLYSVLYSLGLLPETKLLKLRRMGGIDGHPDICTPGIEANSGSLGMGISKGRGMAWAKKYFGFSGRVFVLTGDGEWQEGQNFEALQSAVSQRITDLTVIIDHNKVQSDKFVSEIVDLFDLERKLGSFGWFVVRCDGHDHKQLGEILSEFETIANKPKMLIADTIKGKGVSFMEHPRAIMDGGGYYKWHAGAPADDFYTAGHGELIARINKRLENAGIASVQVKNIDVEPAAKSQYGLEGEPDSRGADVKTAFKGTAEFVADAYGKALVEIAKKREDLVVLDADLSADCRVRPFELAYPERFIECGIAEQDMVSMAGGLARQGLLPVVNTFASFLASRANEQIYNNATEHTKIIYVCHYAGLIPAGPGKSHQSIRDVSLLGALPNCTILQPCNPSETEMVLAYAVDEAEENCMIRLIIGPSPRNILLPKNYKLTPGHGVDLTEGREALLFAYGPVMIHEALIASDILEKRGIGLRVVNMPWLNRVDKTWLSESTKEYANIFVLEDHAPIGGLADMLLSFMFHHGMLTGKTFERFAVEGYPACGTPTEVLAYHGLDGASLATRISEKIARNQNATQFSYSIPKISDMEELERD